MTRLDLATSAAKGALSLVLPVAPGYGYPMLIYFNEVDKGGHFAAWEQPELFAAELRAAFRSLR
jgi:pimeloyl-ACP methyl ester carboxylesterase